MRLKNKQTGEIVIANVTRMVSGVEFDCGQTLAELNAEWCDAPEEPKKHYEILSMGAVMEREDAEDEIFRNQEQREIGNYFSSREEAELALRKLKAWKRLKDKGFEFDGRYKANYGETFTIRGRLPKDTLVIDVVQDLDLLFGDKE